MQVQVAKNSIRKFKISKLHKRKVPLRKGSCRAAGFPNASEISFRGSRVSETEGLVLTFDEKSGANPSVIFLRKCHLPLHSGGFA